jgi:putative flavoprotein involved in K+ transport
MTIDTALDLIEEGAAAVRLGARTLHLARREAFDVIVIGGGQAGLSAGYHLARAGLKFVILDAHARVGDAWRRRWDSLRLFTPAKYDGLDGMRFPAPPNSFPTKNDMADYLETYARRFALPVRTNARVEHLRKRGDRYVVSVGDRELEAPQVIVAMAKYQRGHVPEFAARLSRDIVQLHSIDYRGPQQLKRGGVLLVGAGNSGADIALETARAGHRTWLAGRDVGQVPFRPEGFWGRNLFGPLLIGFLFKYVLTVHSPLGRKGRTERLAKGGPLIRVKRVDLDAAGIERVARVTDVESGLPRLADGRVLPAANVIWCSGFDAAFEWIDLPIFDEHGHVVHQSGVVEREPGLYFLGLPFLHSFSSSMVHGVGRDAARIVRAIRSRARVSEAKVAR